MGYELVAVENSGELFIRRAGDADNALYLRDLRDLLLVRQRINEYLDHPVPDTTVPPLVTRENVMISSVQARQIAGSLGVDLHKSTITTAIVRGHIPGAVKRGSRWYVPHDSFMQWFGQSRVSQ